LETLTEMAEKQTHDLRTQVRGEARLSAMGSAEGNSESLYKISRANYQRKECSEAQPALRLLLKSMQRYEKS
jgi:hypothetical protein